MRRYDIVCGIMCGIVMMAFGCSRAPSLRVMFPSPHGLEAGDRVMMNDVAIGTIREVSLETPSRVVCSVDLERHAIRFINQSTVFTYGTDTAGNGGKCLICKNCDDMAPAIERGHSFTGMGFVAYSLACIGHQADAIWLDYMKEQIEEVVRSGGDFSRDAREKLEVFARSNAAAFNETMHELNHTIQELDDDAKRTLEDIRRSAGP
ncbi:MCE family protein [bacterium]|nr:MCE family protein [candidate division CSSED10-310 bacterium]